MFRSGSNDTIVGATVIEYEKLLYLFWRSNFQPSISSTIASDYSKKCEEAHERPKPKGRTALPV